MTLPVIPPEALDDPLLWLKSESYQWQLEDGTICAAVPYSRDRTDFFRPQPYLPYLYNRTASSGRSRLGSIPALFCGMTDLTSDAICSYLHQRLVLVLGEYRPSTALIDPADPLPDDFEELCEPEFYALGYAFPATLPIITSADGQANAMFGGYTFFQEAWRTPQQTILMLLGLAFLFQEFRLVNLHGIRYADNGLTARWASKFGFEDLGTIPNFMPHSETGSLVAGTVSTLSRERLVNLLRAWLTKLRDAQETDSGIERRGT